METKENLTPVMKQYFGIKNSHPDRLLLFRCGDFYETYEDDAVSASKILGITLTKSREWNRLARFPNYALDTYLTKLIRAGRKVAICEQLEDPKLMKKKETRSKTELLQPYKKSQS